MSITSHQKLFSDARNQVSPAIHAPTNPSHLDPLHEALSLSFVYKLSFISSVFDVLYKSSNVSRHVYMFFLQHELEIGHAEDLLKPHHSRTSAHTLCQL
jgi:hypothetical protein